jgi:hypothetical protein
MNNFNERATILTGRGIPVVPVEPGQKRCTIPGWPSLATTDLSKLKQWADSEMNSAAVATPDGVCILDCDQPDLLERIEGATRQKIPTTLVVKSAGRGCPHVYFKQTERSRKLGNRKAADLFDFKGDRSYVVGPGSKLENGRTYDIVNDAPIADCPDWLVDWVEKNSDRPKSNGRADGPAVVEDFDIDDFLGHYGLDYEQVGDWFVTDVCPIAGYKHEQSSNTGFFFDGEHLGFHCFASGCDGSSMSVGEVIKRMNQGEGLKLRAPYPKQIWPKVVVLAPSKPITPELQESDLPDVLLGPDKINCTQLGNAERLLRDFRDRLRWTPGTTSQSVGTFYVWHGTRWRVDTDGTVNKWATATARNLGQLVKQAVDLKWEQKDIQGLTSFWKQSETDSAIAGLMSCAGPLVAIDPADFDADPLLLGVLNGTVDLQTGRRRDASKADYITKLCRAKFDINAQCPTWEQFLRETTGGDVELIKYLQTCVGFCLTGLTDEHLFFIITGPGGTGKTTFAEAS